MSDGFTNWLRAAIGLGPAAPKPTLDDHPQAALFQGLPVTLAGAPGDLARFWQDSKLPQMRRILQALSHELPGPVSLAFDVTDPAKPRLTVTGTTRSGEPAFRQEIGFGPDGIAAAPAELDPALPGDMKSRLPRLVAENLVELARAARLQSVDFPNGKLLLDNLDMDVSYREVWLKHLGPKLPYSGRAELPAIGGGRTSMAPDTPFYTIRYPVTKPSAPWQTVAETHSITRDAKPERRGGGGLGPM